MSYSRVIFVSIEDFFVASRFRLFRFGQIIVPAHHLLTCFLLQLFPRATGNSSTFTGGGPVLAKALGILFPGNLSGGRLAKHGEDQLQIGHVIAEIFTFQPFQLFMF